MAAASGSEAAAGTRLIAVGSAALVEGFGLIGFETYPDASVHDLEVLLDDLVRHRSTALILLESELARCPCRVLERIRSQYVSIVVVEVPQLNAPADFHPQVEELVRSVLGPSALEPNP